MISASHPSAQMTASQAQAQQAARNIALERAKIRSQKPTDKQIPEGVDEFTIGDGVHNYKGLRDVERRLDSAMMRKRLDIQDEVNRNVKVESPWSLIRVCTKSGQCHKTLRIWISNTVEDQPWQGDGLDVDAFDFSTNMDSSYRVKIEGRLLDDEEELDSDDSDEEDDEVIMDPDAMEEDIKASRKSKTAGPQYKLSHFFKSMTVDFGRSRAKDGSEQSVEWKKPIVSPNSPPPASADFNQLEFKRGADENLNITINLVRDNSPEVFTVSPVLSEVIDKTEATRAEVLMGIWEYIKTMGLQEDDEKRQFRCDDRLRAVSWNAH